MVRRTLTRTVRRSPPRDAPLPRARQRIPEDRRDHAGCRAGLAIAVAAFVVTDYFNRFNEGAVTLEDAPEVEPPSISAFPGEFSVLLIGTDECGEVSTGLLGERCSEADGGILNDVNLLVHVSAEPRKVTVISFPRDLMLETPSAPCPTAPSPRRRARPRSTRSSSGRASHAWRRPSPTSPVWKSPSPPRSTSMG